MTEQRKREIQYLERLQANCRAVAKEQHPSRPQLRDIGLHARSPEWDALYGALADAGYYDAAPREWSRRIDKAIRDLKSKVSAR